VTEVSEAELLILERVPTLDTLTISLTDALGTVLRQNVFADRDHPPFHRVTMDGIAIAYQDWGAGKSTYQVLGTQGAGMPPMKLTETGQCVEIMTGAVLPEGADTVIPIERVKIKDSKAKIDSDTSITERQFIHSRGSDRVAGSQLIHTGSRIGPKEIAVLASAGYAQVTVSRLAKVAVISTGNELVDAEGPVKPHQIRSTNGRAIEASLAQHQLAQTTRVRLKDDRKKMLSSIRALHHDNDFLILSGGVSMGKYDFVPAVLEELGVNLVFHRIEQRPGHPMWFGVSDESKLVFALPGNPVSTLVCLTRYVLPALRQTLGLKPANNQTVALGKDVGFSANLTYFLPVKLNFSDKGLGIALPRPTNTSGDFLSLADTDGFVQLPKDQSRFKKGTTATFFRW
jgi:molybdopterin molybdotransferase